MGLSPTVSIGLLAAHVKLILRMGAFFPGGRRGFARPKRGVDSIHRPPGYEGRVYARLGGLGKAKTALKGGFCTLARRASRQLFEQRLGVLQVGGVKAFSEPAVDLGQRQLRSLVADGGRRGRAEYSVYLPLVLRGFP
jgi:hypothetical protein